MLFGADLRAGRPAEEVPLRRSLDWFEFVDVDQDIIIMIDRVAPT